MAVSPDSEPLEHHQVLLHERTRLCACLALATRLNPLLSAAEINELVVLLGGIAQHAEGVTGACLHSLPGWFTARAPAHPAGYRSWAAC